MVPHLAFVGWGILFKKVVANLIPYRILIVEGKWQANTP